MFSICPRYTQDFVPPFFSPWLRLACIGLAYSLSSSLFFSAMGQESQSHLHFYKSIPCTWKYIDIFWIVGLGYFSFYYICKWKSFHSTMAWVSLALFNIKLVLILFIIIQSSARNDSLNLNHRSKIFRS